MLENFIRPGEMSFVLGGQWGSEAKGSAVAYMARELEKRSKVFDIVTTNNGVQSGHTSIHEGKKRVLFHLPTYPLIANHISSPLVYLNGGSIIDPLVLEKEIHDNPDFDVDRLRIHPNAAVVTEECRAAEMDDNSPQTKIASTRKGVGHALASKILRSGVVAKDHPYLSQFVSRVDLNAALRDRKSVLAEVPQGVGLSLNGPFYPHCTSRDSTVAQATSDAGVHPHRVGPTMLVLRTYPIRVGNIVIEHPMGLDHKEIGHSGGHYPDQREISFDNLGVEAEITTVTKRVRRIFTWSDQQVAEAIAISRPSIIFLSFCDYIRDEGLVKELVNKIKALSLKHGISYKQPEILCGWGPTTADVKEG